MLGDFVFSLAAACAAGGLLLIALMATLAVYRSTVRSLGDRETQEAVRERVAEAFPDGIPVETLRIVATREWNSRAVAGALQVASEAIVLSETFLRAAKAPEVRALVARQAYAACACAKGWAARTLAWAAAVMGGAVFAGVLTDVATEAENVGGVIVLAGLALCVWLVGSRWDRLHAEATTFACDREGRDALQRALVRMKAALMERGEATPEVLRRRLAEVEPFDR